MSSGSPENILDVRLFRDVFNASPIGIAVESLEGRPVFVNPALCSMLGFNDEEMRSKHCVDFSPPEDAAKDWELFQQLKAGAIDHYQIEKRYVRRDGSLLWGSLSVSLLNSGPSPLVVAVVEDITDKKKAEEARFRHAAVIESSDDAIASGTLDGIIVSWNKGAEKIYGYTEAEAVGQPINMLVPPELPDEEHKILETLKAGGRIEHFETVRVSKTGKRINVSLTISPIRDSSGRTVGISGIARDITERRRAEEALRVSEERLRLAQQAARIGTFEWNIETGVNTWTPELEAMYGLPLGGFGRTQTAFENLVHPDDRARIMELNHQAFKTGLPTTGEWRVIWPDGSVHWIAGGWQVFMNQSAQPIRVIGVNMDVTERIVTEDRLREYERAVENAEEMIAVVDGEYRYLIANRQFLQMRNMTREQVVGHFAHEVLNKEVFETAVKPKLDECFQGKVVRYELKYSYPELGERDILVSYFPIEGSGGIDRVACILQDITERKRSEESLRESEQRFRLAAQAGRMYSFEWDVTTDIVVRSPEHIRILGATEPLRFTHTQFVETIHPDDRPTFIATIAGLTPEKPTAEITYRMQKSDGALAWLKSSGRAFFNAEGKLLRVIGMVADITDLKQAEEAVSAMTRKLIEAQEQERARIARELHDDVNQRLAMLAVELDQLKDNPSEVSICVQELRKQVTQISSDVQALSHDLHSSSLDYLGVVAGMKGWCKEFAERQGMQIECRQAVESALPREIGLCLFRVLQEALFNAAKHSGVRRMEVELSENSGEIHLTIRDLGKGFDVAAAKQGKGLGLTSMRERVRLVNGTIAIDSNPRCGTTIRVRVPLPLEQGYHRAVL